MLKKTRVLPILILSLVLILAACSGSSSTQNFVKEEDGVKATMKLDVDGEFVKKLAAESKVNLEKLSELEASTLETTFNAMKETFKQSMGIDVTINKTDSEMVFAYTIDLTDEETVKKVKEMGLFENNVNNKNGDKLEYKPVEESLLKDGWKKQ